MHGLLFRGFSGFRGRCCWNWGGGKRTVSLFEGALPKEIDGPARPGTFGVATLPPFTLGIEGQVDTTLGLSDIPGCAATMAKGHSRFPTYRSA